MSGEKVERWVCSGCEFLLGYVESKEVLRIKRKDLYVEIKGGEVRVNCCRCGKLNILADDKGKEIVDLVENNEEGR